MQELTHAHITEMYIISPGLAPQIHTQMDIHTVAIQMLNNCLIPCVPQLNLLFLPNRLHFSYLCSLM